MENDSTVSAPDRVWGSFLPPSDAALALRSGPGAATVPGECACVLTLFTLYRRPVFRNPVAARAVAQAQARTLPRDHAAWLAWVLLPDCWQGLLVCGRNASLPALVGRFKAMTTRAVHPRHRINGWLWGRGHRAVLLASDQSLGDAARFLVAAPRRAGLVERLADYPYWESAWDPEDANVANRTQRGEA